MAEIKPEVITTPLDGQGLKLVKWTGISSGDDIIPFRCGAYSDKTLHFSKGSAFGGNVGAEGSLDPDLTTARYAVCADPNGNALTGFTSDRVENVLEHVYLIRPTAGAGVSGVDVWLLLSSGRG